MTTPDHVPQPPVSPQHRTRLIIALAVGAVVLVAVTAVVTATAVGGKTSPQPTAAPAAAAATTAAAALAPTTAAPSPTRSSIPSLGAEVTKPDSSAKVTAYAYKQPVAENAPRPQQSGFEWAAADVQVCALIDNTVVTNRPWHLVYADHTTIESSSTGYRQFPEPSYPWGEKDLPKDRCVRGWITFPAPVDKRPVSIEHNPQGSLTEWAIT